MKVVVFFCFLAARWDELTSSIIHQKKEGTVFRVQLKVSSSETSKFFCRRECEEAAVLITTAGDRAQSGRFSIEYKNSSSAAGVLSVTITHLNKSDTDRYRFGLGTPPAPRVYKDFQIKVLDAAQEEEFNIHTRDEGQNVTVLCNFPSSKSKKVFCKKSCEGGTILIETTSNRADHGRYSMSYSSGPKPGLRVAISNLTTADSGLYTCGLGDSLSSASFQKFEINVAGDSSHISPTGFLLPVVISGAVVAVLTAAITLVLHRLQTKKKNPGGSSMEVTLLSVTYDDVSLHSNPDKQTAQQTSHV